MDVRNGVGASWVFNNQVIDADIKALLEADSEIRFWQRAKVVADFGILASHVDDHRAVRQLFDEFMLVGFQHTHEAKILWGDFAVEVALKDGVRHLVAEDDKTATANAKQGFHTAFDVFMYAFVVLVKDD